MLYDITRPLVAGRRYWGDDAGIGVDWSAHHEAGDVAAVTRLSLSTHSGTHIDAPLHFMAGGDAVDKVPLTRFWGPALVLDIPADDNDLARPLSVADLEAACLDARLASDAWQIGERLLLRTDTHPGHEYAEPYATVSADLAAALAAAHVRLLGIDTPSVDAEDTDYPAHRTLLSADCVLLEWLDLSRVPSGAYELVALPLHLPGRDGSPVRAVLRDT